MRDIRFIPDSSASTPIDWTRVPEASKKVLLAGWGRDWETESDRPLPATVGDLAKMFSANGRFFGYFRSILCTLLMDISEFGLEVVPGPGTQVGPRFYMKHMEQIWFLLFMPGKRYCISGYSEDIIREEVDEYEEEEEEEGDRMEIEIAKKFDLKLVREVSKGAADIVDITKKLGGWEATMLHQDLEDAQFHEAIMTLPHSHSASIAHRENMVETVRNSLRRRQ
ncbi:hypothetical protein PILCRDRAFT_826247 [Piloderma croceum F 1598]|uniref:Uncharacterized protein n=1 Tax=Piloderma croceum (strain F 1598) TaxID=765440 RepID=A0A0C3EVD5_PILCF|nr:hypothetical protein PILCRDRAFT_826247 [Piloderma croceum F 1598]